MGRINTGRVVAGGLVAGVVANALDMFWNLVVLKDDMAAVAGRLGLTPEAAGSFSTAAPWILVDFIVGLIVVWTYAAIRPRFGPGPRTAIVAALGPWLAATVVVYGFASMGLMSDGVFVRGALSELVTYVLAALAGGAIYKES